MNEAPSVDQFSRETRAQVRGPTVLNVFHG